MLLYSVNLMPISVFMKHLLSGYGNMTVYLDARHNLSDYADISLFRCPFRCQHKFCSDGEKPPYGRPADPRPSSSPRGYTRRLQIQNRSIIGPMEGSRSELSASLSSLV